MMYDKDKNENEAESLVDSGFCAFFEHLEQRDDTIRLFDRGEFYSVHGNDARYVAQNFYHTTSVLKWFGRGYKSGNRKEGLPSCTMRPEQAKTFLREALTARQLRIQIWIPEAGAPKKNPNKWKMDKQASPGNVTELEELLFANSDMLVEPIIMSIKVATKDKVKTIGVAFSNTSLREIGVGEFVDNDLFSNTESLMIQLSVKECLLPIASATTQFDLGRVREMAERCGVVITERKAAEFNAKNVEQDLNRLLDTETSSPTLPEFDLTMAMGATAALLSYLSLLTDSSNYGQYKLRRHNLAQFMKLDASALKALTLMPSPEDVNKTSSLFGLLNKCKTPQGTRLLSAWLRQPLVNIHEIRKRQDLVEVFVNESNSRRIIQQEYMNNMPDLHRISKRLRKGVASLEEIVRVYQTALKLPDLIKALEEVSESSCKQLMEEIYINEFQKHHLNLEKYVEMVEATLDLSEKSLHTYVIKPEYDEGLQELAKKIRAIRDTLDEEHARVGEDLNLELDKKLHMENKETVGYVFRVTKTDAKAIQNKREYEELKQVKGGIYFRTKTLKEAAENYADSTVAYQKRQSSLVKEVVNIASTYAPVMESLDALIAHLDVIICFSHVSSNAPIPFVKPVLSDMGGSKLLLKEARHPCLEIHEEVNFIPNDVEMSKGTSELQIITGPNMGGKSTYIRQVGVIALMSQVGCFVPCQEAQLPIFDSILARVGAGDSQLKGVSTFMAEMLETANILHTATANSLIIIDELGRGTSTADGFALAWAISEFIATKIRAFCLFATHFHELTTLAEELPQVKNLHVTAHVAKESDSMDSQDITLLYKVEPGICDQSFGIHVAKLAHFPESIIKLAKRKADELEDFGEKDVVHQASEEEIAEGSKLIATFLKEWASKTDGDDVVMTEAGNAEEEIARLKQYFERWKPQIQANRWCENLLGSL